MENRVIHFQIQADDVDRAKMFYEKALGWKITQMMTKKEGGMDYWGITTGKSKPGINGGLYKRPKEKDQVNYLYDCTILVPDIDKAVKDVSANGGTIVQGRMELKGVGYFAGCKDTEGNRFALMQATEWKPE
jgi:uncharacterized protein